jgi:hypothetical protein
VRLYLFVFISFIIEGEGVEVNVFLSPSLHCTDEKKWPSGICQGIPGLFSD